MAGTDEEAVAAADEALYVLTAVLLTPAQFPSVLGDDYPEACAALELAPRADGYGLVLGQDGEGSRWTVVIDDVSLVAVAIASWDCGMEYDLSPDERTVVAALPGWPLAVAVAAPNVPAPHDPGPEVADRAPLTPPDTSTWGPAQRRLGADEIALQWAVWREQIGDDHFSAPPAPADASQAPQKAPEDAETAPEASEEAPKGHAGIRRVLAEAWPTWTRLHRWAGSARRSPPATPVRCVPTGPAGRWWPAPTTSPSCSSTRSPARSCP